MNIGFTGSRGFIGSYLLRYIASKGLGTIRILVRNVTAVDESGAEIVHGDLLSTNACERFAKGLNIIFYLAHCNTPVNSDWDQPKDALLNLVPFLNLLQSIRALQTKPHLVYFSSGGAVYGHRRDRTPFLETDPCAPLTSYGIQKLAAENYLRLAAEKGDLTCTVLRVGNAYGTLLPQERMQGLIGVAINNVMHNRPVRVFGSLENVRDYVHLDDICTIAERVAQSGRTFSILNVGSGIGHSVKEVLQTIQDCVESRMQLEAVPEVDIGRWLTDWVVLDISKARNQFDWRPSVAFRHGIQGMISQWRSDKHFQSTVA